MVYKLITGRKAALPDAETKRPSSDRRWKTYRAGKREAGLMNRTETEFANTVLTAWLEAGLIWESWYEPFSMRLTAKTPEGKPGIRYTPDFGVQLASLEWVLYEVKGTGLASNEALNRVKLVADKYRFRIFVARKQTKKNGGGFTFEQY